MNLAARLVELPQRLAWKRAQAMTPLYRRAFRAWGPGTVMVSPLKVQGPERISVGRDCSLFPGVWLAAEPSGDLVIGNCVYLGHRVHLHAVGSVQIGNGCMLTDDVHVGNGGHDPQAKMAVTPGAPIIVGNDVFIGQKAMVLGGVTIGDGAVVGAGAVVTKDVPSGTVVAGVPARPVGRTPAAPADPMSSKETV